MTISPRARRTLLAAALAASALASVWPRAHQGSAPQIVAAVTGQSEAAALAQPAVVALPALPRVPERAARRGNTEVQDLFSPTDWNPPPPTRPPPPTKPRDAAAEIAVAPPPPAAPPFPYLLSGTLIDGDGALLVFTKAQETFAVRVGEVLDREYRAEGADARAITLTYLPLNLTQRIAANHPEALSTPFEAPQFALSERSTDVVASAAKRDEAPAERPAEPMPRISSTDHADAELGLSD